MPKNVSNFEVFDAMCAAGDVRIKAAPVSNILRAQTVKAGAQITIGWGDPNVINDIAQGRVCGGLILCDKAAFDEWKAKLEAE